MNNIKYLCFSNYYLINKKCSFYLKTSPCSLKLLGVLCARASEAGESKLKALSQTRATYRKP